MKVLVYAAEYDPNDTTYGQHSLAQEQVVRVPNAPGVFRLAAQLILGEALLPDPLYRPATVTVQALPLPNDIVNPETLELLIAEMYYSDAKYFYVAGYQYAEQQVILHNATIVAKLQPNLLLRRDGLTRPVGRLVYEFDSVECYII